MFKNNERYLCAYLCNKHKISYVQTLLDFYNEIANMSFKTKNSYFLQLRLQWVIDALKGLFNHKNSGVKVVDNLLPIIKKYNFILTDFTSMVEARNIEKEYIAFNSISEYVVYSKKSSGKLWQMIARIYNFTPKEEKAAYWCGIAFAIVGNIRNYDFDSKRLHYKLVFNKETFLKNKNEFNKRLKENIRRLLKIAESYIKASKKVKLTKRKKALLLLNIFTEGYIYNIRRNLNNILEVNATTIPMFYKIKFILRYIFK